MTHFIRNTQVKAMTSIWMAKQKARELAGRTKETGPDKLRAVCSVILDDCFLVKNVRVVEGEKGLFVSLPSRRNVKGEWTEQCFPMTKELREKLSAVVLAEYDRALAAEDGGGTPAA